MTFRMPLTLWQKSPFTARIRAPILFFFVARTRQGSAQRRVHATARLAGTDCADDGGAREESAVRGREPMRTFGRPWLRLLWISPTTTKAHRVPWVG